MSNENKKQLPRMVSLKRLSYLGDVELEEREFNGYLIGIAEDSKEIMRRDDGTSEQYIVYLKRKNVRNHKRYITRLGCKKYVCDNAKELALAIFRNPDDYKNIVGDGWMGYKSGSDIPKKAVQA